jgi:hypothetical protein
MKPRFRELTHTPVFESTIRVDEYTPDSVTGVLVRAVQQIQHGQRLLRICGDREEREFSIFYDKQKGLSIVDTAVDITVLSLERIHELPRYKYVDISPVRRVVETHYPKQFQQGILTDELQSKVQGSYLTPAKLMDMYPTAVAKCMSGCAGLFSLWMDVENLSDITTSTDRTIKRFLSYL